VDCQRFPWSPLDARRRADNRCGEETVIDFEPTEDQRIMRDTVAQLAKASISQRAREFEAARAVADEVRQAAAEMGLAGVLLPESCGGAALGMTTAVLLEEELGKADAATAFALPGPGSFGLALLELGSTEQQAELLAPFADGGVDRYGAVAWSEPRANRERAGFSTVARRVDGGWELSGKKSFVCNARAADRFVVFAQIDEGSGWNGIGAFVVLSENPGVRVGDRHDTLGLDAAWFGEVAFEHCKVPASAQLAPADFTLATLRFFARHALIVAARAVGLAQFAFDVAREYCDTRQAFGKPIGHFQAVAFNLADRAMDVESARWLLWKAAWSWDAGKGDRACVLASAQAAAQSLDVAMRCGDDCVSLHGGAGFIRDVIAEKLMRDAKQLALTCPTAEQLDQWAAAVELGAPLDPALLLPTPEAQAIFT
jgi:alkylation response protein AidB-like acyl-CoA dehydrogenase